MYDPSKIMTAMESLKKIQGDSKIITNRGILSTLFSDDIYSNLKENPKILKTFNSIMGNPENMEHYSNFLTGRFYSGRNLNDMKAYNNALNFISDTYGAEEFADFFWGQQIKNAQSFDDIESTLDNLSKFRENFYSNNKLLNSPGFSSEGLDNYLRKNFTNDWAQEIKRGIGNRLPDLKPQIKDYKSFNDFINVYDQKFLKTTGIGLDATNRELNRISSITDDEINKFIDEVKGRYDPKDIDRIRDYAFHRRNSAGETYKEKQKLFTRQGYKHMKDDLYIKSSERIDDLLSKDLGIKDINKLINFSGEVAQQARIDLGLDKTNYISKFNLMLEKSDGTKGGFYNTNLIQVNLADKWNTLVSYYKKKFEDASPEEYIKGMKQMRSKIQESFMNVIGHEYRHAWQDHVDGGKMKEGMDWEKYKTDYNYYYDSPIEKDARKYGAEFAERHKEKFKAMFDSIFEDEVETGNTNTRNLKRGEGTYRVRTDAQEWDVPDAPNSPIGVQDTSKYKNLKRGEGTYRTIIGAQEWDVPDAPDSPIGVEDTLKYKDLKRREGNATASSEAAVNQTVDKPAGPKQGDAFWDSKNKRQLVYDGPDSVHGNHNFYTREGTVVNSSMDNLSPYKGKARLDYDMLKNYNTELNRFEQLTSPYFNLKYNDPETFYTDLTKNINKIDEYEKIIGSKYKSFKGNKSYHKTRSYMSDEINKHFGSNVINTDPFNRNRNNTSTNTSSVNTTTRQNTTVVNQPKPEPEPDTTVPERSTRRSLTAEEQAAVDRANAQWRADNEARYADMDKQIENMYKADDIVFGTPEQILDPNYISPFDPLEETIESTIDAAEEATNQASKSTPHRRTGRQTGRYARQRNAERQSTKNRGRSGNAKGKTGSTKSIDELHQEANQRKWVNEQYAKNQAEQLNKYKQTYEDILDDWKKTSGNFSGNLDNRNLKMPNRLINNGSDSHQMYIETGDYYKYIEDANTDYYREKYTDGSYTMDEQVFKYTEGEGIDGKTVLKNEGELIDNANEYAQQLDDTLKNAKNTMSPEDFEVFRNGYTPETTIRRNGNTPELKQRKVLRNSHLIESPAKFGAMDTIMSGVNILGAVGDYKAARRKGHGVISSAVRAGTQFAVYEALGAWAIPVSLLQHAPGAVIKGADMLYKENRRMNSAANFQVFGDAQFMDTQQLATMRQSGMEMAKMSQYNLQQTLMGNEATYLHR